jgi:hypothetical protein
MEQIYTGIDVAKDSFVVAIRSAGKVTPFFHCNDQKGIKEFLKSLPSPTWCIMEAEPQMHGFRSAGKAKKVALVAVMNKLRKQVFGIVHSGEVYTSAYLMKS